MKYTLTSPSQSDDRVRSVVHYTRRCVVLRDGVLWLLSCFSFLTAHAQDILSTPIVFSCQNCTPAEAFVQLSQQSKINFVFNPTLLKDCPSKDYAFPNLPLSDVIEQLGQCAKLSVKLTGNDIVLYKKQSKYTLSGYVQDAENGERLIGATVAVFGEKNTGAITNEFGFFSLRLDESDYGLSVQRIGYKAELRQIELIEDKMLVIKIRPNTTLPEIIVRPGASDSAVSSTNVPKNILTTNLLQSLPMPGGEPDLMRQIGFENGVQTGVDGIGGLHIRGGNADQNLILMDDVPVYNPGHALGLFSIFNTQTVNQARLWKGDFPAKYGGRISSVLDVRTRDGNMRKWQGNVAAGLFAGSAMLEGPLKKEKSSLLVGYRDTYFQPWANILERERSNLVSFLSNDVKYRFYDFNLKFNHIFSEKDRVFLALYKGNDLFRSQYSQEYISTEGIVTDKFRLGSDWGNEIASLRWNHVLGGNIFTNTTLRYSQFVYRSKQGFNSTFLASKGGQLSTIFDYGQFYQTRIQDYSGKTDFTWYAREHSTLRGGVSFTRHQFRPGALSINYLIPGQSQEEADSISQLLLNDQRLKADETEAYLDGEWHFKKRWRVESGLNFTYFTTQNAQYNAILPRLKLLHVGQRGWRHWAGVYRTAQFLHQIGAFNISLPFELWVPSTANVKPERATQYAAGIGFEKKGWRLQGEFYYKDMDRVLSFISLNDALSSGGAVDANGWEDRVLSGTGKSRGFECSVERFVGWFNFSINYTNAKSTRRFDDFNSGREFPFRFDRRQDVKLVLNQRIASWLNFTGSWQFATGNPITLAGVKITHQGTETDREVIIYSEVNGYRLPNFHRLDLGLNLKLGGKRMQHFVQLGAYNVYNRANPFYLYLDTESGVRNRAVQYTLLPLLPVFRYEIRL